MALLAEHPAAREVIVDYKQDWPVGGGLRGEFITFHLVRHDGTRTATEPKDLDQFPGTPWEIVNAIVHHLVEYMATPDELVEELRARLDGGQTSVRVSRRFFRDLYRLRNQDEVIAKAAAIADERGWESLCTVEAVAFRQKTGDPSRV